MIIVAANMVRKNVINKMLRIEMCIVQNTTLTYPCSNALKMIHHTQLPLGTFATGDKKNKIK